MKKILMVIDSLGAGGAEKVALTLASALKDESYHVDMITIDNISSYQVDEGISLLTLNFKKGLSDYAEYRKKLHKMIDDLQADGVYEMIIVHLQKATRLMKGYHHDNLFNVVHSTLSQASLSNRKGIRKYLKTKRLHGIYNGLSLVAVSNGIAEDIKKIGIRPNSLKVIYNPVDVKELQDRAEEPSGCFCQNDYIVYVGRLAESKRHDRALEAYKKSGISASFLIVGEGEMRKSIEARITELGLTDRVTLCGFQSNPYPIIKKAKLLVLSSDYEGLPTVLIEALSLGVPVVSTDCPSGPREILGDYMPDSLVAMDDTDALAAAIKSHIDRPPFISEKLVSRFNSRDIALEYLEMRKSKNILMVIDSLEMGGAEKVVLTLTKGFIEMGHHIDLIIIDDKIDFDLPKEITLYTLGFRKGLFDYVRYERKLHALVNSVAAKYEDGLDGIFVHLQKATRLMRRYRHPKMFFCVHSTISMSSLNGRSGLRLAIKKRRLQNIYNNLNIITVSDGIQNDLLEIVGVKPLSVQTIYNPIDIQEITELSKEKLPNMIEGDYIIHVGRLAESKRHDRLIDAYMASGIDAKLLIVGEGNMRPTIEKKIVEMGLNDKIVMYGFSANPYPLMAHAKLLALTSDYEGFGNVLVETMCLGIPVLSTDCPSGPREILKGDLLECLVSLSEEKEFAVKLGELYLHNIERSNLISTAKRFDTPKITKQYVELLK